MDIFDYMEHQYEKPAFIGCSECLCHTCEKHNKGCCWDNKRKVKKPYMTCHDKPVTLMSNWKNYLDEWCKGGIFYPTHHCKDYIKGSPTIVNGTEFW